MSKVQRIIAAAFLAVGLILLAIGIYIAVVPAIPPEFVGKTQATITDIVVSYDSSSSRSSSRRERHTVMVAYEVEGKTYEGELGYYATGMYIDQQVDIEYDTRQPGRMVSPAGRMVGMIVLLALGLVFSVLGVVLQFMPVPVFMNGRRVA